MLGVAHDARVIAYCLISVCLSDRFMQVAGEVRSCESTHNVECR